jgi:hypothetical protein
MDESSIKKNTRVEADRCDLRKGRFLADIEMMSVGGECEQPSLRGTVAISSEKSAVLKAGNGVDGLIKN